MADPLADGLSAEGSAGDGPRPVVVHRPVLLREILEGLDLSPGATALDATVGLGGHAEAILEGLGPKGRLIGIDRDEQALERARERLSRFGKAVELIHGNLGELMRLLEARGIGPLDAALFDLGVSSLQLETPERGFSFAREGPLDMRMDRTEPLTAGELVNRASEEDLRGWIREYGQERWAGRIARAIVRKRPFRTTTDLAEVIRGAVPSWSRRERIDPATRTFQAIRIAVNRELEAIPQGLEQAIRLLKPGGRIAALAYHSLEDRLVKSGFRGQARAGVLRVLTPKPIRPSEEETARNPRARSARLRVAQRTEDSP